MKMILGTSLLILFVLALCALAIFYNDGTIYGISFSVTKILPALFSGLTGVAVFMTLFVQWSHVRESKEVTQRTVEAQEKYAQIMQVTAQLEVLQKSLEVAAHNKENFKGFAAQSEVEKHIGKLLDKRNKLIEYIINLEPPV